ncbi:MAG: electron transport complex subunit RsxB [Gammaproteobacteria bacterium]|nr:electron transport complex subunit RsxB [Gammaproteobacteria bacterium]
MMLTEILAGVLLLAVIGLVSGGVLLLSSRRWQDSGDEVTSLVNKLLPQTQCAQCGYPGCKPYAEAIVAGEAINKCPPGGDNTIRALADLLGKDFVQLDESCGTSQAPMVALIREPECIGCTLCIKACPVDAIIGAQQMMHTIIFEECTGCELCVAPCPVDCIDMISLEVHEKTEPVHLADSQPCIHCGICMEVCPQDLAPQQLLLFKNSPTLAESLRLQDCIECGLCDRVCPSKIPLTAIFQNTKQAALDQKSESAKAEYIESRFTRRESRLIASTANIHKRPSKAETASLLAGINNRQQP